MNNGKNIGKVSGKRQRRLKAISPEAFYIYTCYDNWLLSELIQGSILTHITLPLKMWIVRVVHHMRRKRFDAILSLKRKVRIRETLGAHL